VGRPTGWYRHRHRAILGALLGAILGVLRLSLWLPARHHCAIHPSLCATLGPGCRPAPSIGLLVLLRQSKGVLSLRAAMSRGMATGGPDAAISPRRQVAAHIIPRGYPLAGGATARPDTPTFGRSLPGELHASPLRLSRALRERGSSSCRASAHVTRDCAPLATARRPLASSVSSLGRGRPGHPFVRCDRCQVGRGGRSTDVDRQGACLAYSSARGRMMSSHPRRSA
jgi:hypothetical protein